MTFMDKVISWNIKSFRSRWWPLSPATTASSTGAPSNFPSGQRTTTCGPSFIFRLLTIRQRFLSSTICIGILDLQPFSSCHCRSLWMEFKLEVTLGATTPSTSTSATFWKKIRRIKNFWSLLKIPQSLRFNYILILLLCNAQRAITHHTILRTICSRWYLLGSSGQAERGRSSSSSTPQHLEFGRCASLETPLIIIDRGKDNAAPLSTNKRQFSPDCMAWGDSRWACHQDICSAESRDVSQRVICFLWC